MSERDIDQWCFCVCTVLDIHDWNWSRSRHAAPHAIPRDCSFTQLEKRFVMFRHARYPRKPTFELSRRDCRVSHITGFFKSLILTLSLCNSTIFPAVCENRLCARDSKYKRDYCIVLHGTLLLFNECEAMFSGLLCFIGRRNCRTT